MELVTLENEIEANCKVLASYIDNNQSSRLQSYAIDLVRNGRCFLPVKYQGRLYFFPSRFIGYRQNGVSRSKTRGDGRLTNRAINAIFGNEHPTENKALERSYKNFCAHIGVIPTANKHKYWKAKQYIFASSAPKASFDTTLVSPNETTAKRLADARRGQGRFRKELLKEWQVCPLTGCSEKTALRASHIKPWSHSSNEERLDPKNGLLLAANIDALFDAHLVTFSTKGQMLISKRLTVSNRKILGCSESMKIALCSVRQAYMKQHRLRFRLREK